MKRSDLPLLPIALLALVVYGGAYGLCRWRKVLIRTGGDMSLMTGRYRRNEMVPGRDLRTTGRGAFKNAVAPAASVVFTPLRLIEAAAWESKRRLE